jgi:hypothetical protein
VPAVVYVSAGASLAQDVNFDAKSYFAGKTILLQVGFGPGGGTDI